MIEIAKRNNPSAQFMQFEARNIELLNDKFDLIVSGFCLPYLSDEERMKFIYQSGKLLEDNGRIYLSFVEGNSANSTYKESPAGRVFFHIPRTRSGCSEPKEIKLYRHFYQESEIH